MSTGFISTRELILLALCFRFSVQFRVFAPEWHLSQSRILLINATDWLGQPASSEDARLWAISGAQRNWLQQSTRNEKRRRHTIFRSLYGKEFH